MTCEFKSHRAHIFKPRTVSVRGFIVPTTTRIRPLEIKGLAHRVLLRWFPSSGSFLGARKPSYALQKVYLGAGEPFEWNHVQKDQS